MTTKSTYAEKLKDPRWQRRRLEIFSRDEFTCKYCNDKETTLHVHHLEYAGNPWDVKDDKLITLCEHCHTVIESDEYHKQGIIIKVIKKPAGEYTFVCLIAEFTTGRFGIIYEIGPGFVELRFAVTKQFLKDIYEFL